MPQAVTVDCAPSVMLPYDPLHLWSSNPQGIWKPCCTLYDSHHKVYTISCSLVQCEQSVFTLPMLQLTGPMPLVQSPTLLGTHHYIIFLARGVAHWNHVH